MILKLNVINDKIKAQNLLAIAEKKDFYLEECYDDSSNSFARRNFTYSANSISEIEMKLLKSLHITLPKKLSDLGDVNIIHVMPSADGGMPHTRPNKIICFPNLYITPTTLLHELWHVHQREFQEEWLHIFKQMEWRIWTGTLPDKLEKNRRYNPDTIDHPLWIFKNIWIPVPIFLNITNPDLKNTEVWFYNVNGYHTRMIPDEFSDYTNLDNIAFEHPREITAYMLAEPAKFSSSNAFKKLISILGNTAI